MHAALSSLNSSKPIAAQLEPIIEAAIRDFEDGRPVDVEALAAAHPEFALQLREVLPMVAALVGFGGAGLGREVLAGSSNGHGADLPHRQLGDFQLIRELGRGGMGTVFEAEQLSMGRRVALKVLPFAALVQQKSLQRFRNEVRAAAALDHPNIVSVYSVGEERGVHFYAMQLIRGQTLAEMIAALHHENAPLSKGGAWGGTAEARHQLGANEVHEAAVVNPSPVPSLPVRGEETAARTIAWAVEPPSTKPNAHARASTAPGSPVAAAERFRSVARLGIQAAEALQHAHDQGVLHRDIKPGNLMLDGEGQLYITDFGLARIEADAGMTMTGDIVGTPRYMAPEQALAKRVVVDQRADVYSLGATLYELLTLEPAFGETDRTELLKQIALEEPQRPRKLDGRIPADLEVIVLKAMAKHRDDRYQTSQQLSDDLRSYCESRPIKARPLSLFDRGRKWSRRHQTLVTVAGVAGALLSAVLAISMAVVKRAESRAVSALKKSSELVYAADIAVAYQAYEKGWLDEVQKILKQYEGDDAARRGFEWRLLEKLAPLPTSTTLVGHMGAVNELAIFPDRRRLASVGDDGTLRIWDLRSHRLLKTISVCDEPLYSVAISPDGRHAVVGESCAYLCRLDASNQVTNFYQTDRNLESIVFTPDGSHVIVGSRYEHLSLVSLSGDVVKRVPCESHIESLEFVPGTHLLLAPNRRGKVGIVEAWDQGLTAVKQEFDLSSHPSDNLTLARPSPSGDYIAMGEGRKSIIYLAESTSGRIVSRTRPSRDYLTDLSFSPSGQAIAAAYKNGSIEYLELQQDEGGAPSLEGRPLVMGAHNGEVKCVRFIDAASLATCGVDGRVQVWRLPLDALQPLEFTDKGTSGIQLSPKGEQLLSAAGGEVLVVDIDSRDVTTRYRPTEPLFSPPVWDGQGNHIALGSRSPGGVVILDRKGNTICSIPHAPAPAEIQFSPDGAHVASVGEHLLQISRADTGQILAQKMFAENVKVVEYSHHGTILACGGNVPANAMLDARTMEILHRLHPSEIHDLAFSPDDATLASGHADSIIRLWDTKTGRLRAELLGHERRVQQTAFSADGRTLLSSSYDGTVRAWAVGTGRSYGVVYRASNTVRDQVVLFSLSSDNRRLAMGLRTMVDKTPDALLLNLDVN